LGLDQGQLTRKRRYHDTVDVAGADANLELAFWGDRILLHGGFELYQEFVGSRRRSLAWSPACIGRISPT
jgi:hypothetical protein